MTKGFVDAESIVHIQADDEIFIEVAESLEYILFSSWNTINISPVRQYVFECFSVRRFCEFAHIPDKTVMLFL